MVPFTRENPVDYTCSRRRWNGRLAIKHRQQTRVEGKSFMIQTFQIRISTNTNKYFYTAQPIPSVAVIPLGTGNDLSRVLGWGKEHDSHMDPMELLRKIQTAEKVKLDRYMP